MAAVTVRSIRDLMVVVHGGPCRDAASYIVPPVVSASDPVVGADYQLPDFLLNFHIIPRGPTKYTNKRSENKFDEIFSCVHPE